jgi:hypothetical protein
MSQALAILAMSLRLWVRIRDRLWGWDDAFVLLSGVASIVGDSMVCLSKLPISWSSVIFR